MSQPVEILLDDGTWAPAVALATKDTERGIAAYCEWEGIHWWAFRAQPDDVDEWRPVATPSGRERP